MNLFFSPPWGRFSQIHQAKLIEKAMLGGREGLIQDQMWQDSLVRDVGDLHIIPPCTITLRIMFASHTSIKHVLFTQASKIRQLVQG